jgi:hypothetical protein
MSQAGIAKQAAQINTLSHHGLGAIAGGGAGAYASLGAQNPEELGRGLNIRIVPANGGTIVSIRDENGFGQIADLYVINEDHDVGTELGKIITLHYLKK